MLFYLVTTLAFAALFYVLFLVIYFVLCVIARWGLFQKMGEAGWKSLIPFYSDYVLFRRVWNVSIYWVWLILSLFTLFYGGEETHSFLFTLMGILLFLLNAYKCYNLSRAFGKGIGFTIGLILLEPIFTMILSFGSSVYYGNPSGSSDGWSF